MTVKALSLDIPRWVWPQHGRRPVLYGVGHAIHVWLLACVAVFGCVVLVGVRFFAKWVGSLPGMGIGAIALASTGFHGIGPVAGRICMHASETQRSFALLGAAAAAIGVVPLVEFAT